MPKDEAGRTAEGSGPLSPNPGGTGPIFRSVELGSGAIPAALGGHGDAVPQLSLSVDAVVDTPILESTGMSLKEWNRSATIPGAAPVAVDGPVVSAPVEPSPRLSMSNIDIDPSAGPSVMSPQDWGLGGRNPAMAATLVLTESRPCPLCDSHDDSRVYAEQAIDAAKLDSFAFASRKLPEYMHHRLVACPTCDTVYASPVPKLDALARAYEEADFDSGEESRYAARTAAGYVKRFIDRLPDFAGALDIGAGDGAFLAELQGLGFTNIVGVEPSTAPIAAAPESVRRLIRQGLFNAADYEPASFSLITCFQVIEHVPDPLELVRGALSLLKPGGAFLMISHNRDALSAKVLGSKSPIFDIEHLQLFSMPSAKRMFQGAGLIDVRGFGVVNRYPLHYYLKLMPIPLAAKIPLLDRARRSPLGKLALPAPLGNLGVIGFKPA